MSSRTSRSLAAHPGAPLARPELYRIPGEDCYRRSGAQFCRATGAAMAAWQGSWYFASARDKARKAAKVRKNRSGSFDPLRT
jgi:hypothetical protein